MEEKQADRVSILLMNPQNGEIYACVNVPEFDLNQPFELNTEQDTSDLSQQEKQDLLNQMWRNPCLNDTYEPGSTFKIITMAAGLEEGVVTEEDSFYCPGYKLVDDRRIHCANRRGHGSQNFVQGAENSCNPVFIEVGLRLGVDNYYKYFKQFGLLKKTGIDLPGEAGTIMHQKNKMGNVELATVSFGQSFQITPIQLAATVSGIINGGKGHSSFCSGSTKSGWEKYQRAFLSGGAGESCQKQPPGGYGTFWKRWYQKAPEKMQRLRAILSEGKQLPHRLFPEVLTDIFLLFLALHQQKSPLFWDFVLFTIPRECITEAP